jgi:cyclopropane fatty-acyl-phospholipid synthase-like methyltransferase
MQPAAEESYVGKFYDQWSKDLLRVGIYNRTMAIHFGYYKKGIKNLEEAILQMNDYVAELLKLQNKKNLTILDAGCGVGGTSIYLSKKYPNVKFIGINLFPTQTSKAKDFAEKLDLKNVHFTTANYMKTEFKDNSFDGIFALESSCYAPDHNDFVNEMYRILKPGARLVVVDCFRKTRDLNPMLNKIYKKFCKDFGNMNPAVLTDFKTILKKRGFSNVIIDDISKNARRSFVQLTIITAPSYVSKIIKKSINFRTKEQTDNLSYHVQSNPAITGLCVLCGIVGYYGISALKP